MEVASVPDRYVVSPNALLVLIVPAVILQQAGVPRTERRGDHVQYMYLSGEGRLYNEKDRVSGVGGCGCVLRVRAIARVC